PAVPVDRARAFNGNGARAGTTRSSNISRASTGGRSREARINFFRESQKESFMKASMNPRNYPWKVLRRLAAVWVGCSPNEFLCASACWYPRQPHRTVVLSELIVLSG